MEDRENLGVIKEIGYRGGEISGGKMLRNFYFCVIGSRSCFGSFKFLIVFRSFGF